MNLRPPGDHCCRTSERSIIGIDEVGRGCLAGHVTAAAVWFPRKEIPDGVDDSKKVSEKKRPIIAEKIRLAAIVSIGHASVREIDAIGIAGATLLAMRRAWFMLQAPSDCLVLVDGDDSPQIEAEVRPVRNGDATCPSIAAASIIAKVERDAMMRVLAGVTDPYGWVRNKGYGSPEHLEAIKANGVSEHHRRSFSPIRQMVATTKDRREKA